jgi:hypothetical protein
MILYLFVFTFLSAFAIKLFFLKPLSAAMLLLLPLFVFYRTLFVMLPSPSLLLERSIDPAADDDCDNSFTN